MAITIITAIAEGRPIGPIATVDGSNESWWRLRSLCGFDDKIYIYPFPLACGYWHMDIGDFKVV